VCVRESARAHESQRTRQRDREPLRERESTGHVREIERKVERKK